MRGRSQRGSTEIARPRSMPAEQLATSSQDHWFDRLTKGLAQGGVSRRQMLGGSVAAVLGLLHPGRVLAKDPAPLQPTAPGKILPHAPPGPSPPRQTPQTGTCTISSQGRNQVVSIAAQTTVGTQVVALTRQTTIGASGTSTIRESITVGGESVFALNMQASPGRPAEGTFQYGPAVSGAKQIVFSSTDRKTMNATVNGRAVAPFTIGTVTDTPRFQDGRPAPHITVAPSIQKAVALVLQQAKAAATKCQVKNSRPLSPQITPANTGQSDDTNNTTACIGCFAGCVAAGVGGGVACCIATLGFGCGACVAGVAAAEVTCDELCHSGPCCPVHCGNVACCFANDTCLDPSRGVCCAEGLSPCHNSQCCQASDTCLPSGCCPKGQAICNSSLCCQPGQACSTENVCCQQLQSGVVPVSCRGTCCPAGEVCKDGVACCPPNDPVCNGVCCRGGGCDANGNCCAPPSKFCGGSNICCGPFNHCCGDSCCDFNQTCVNGTCTTATCPAGQVACPDTPGMCCPPNTLCCPATKTCCPQPNTMCCQEKGCIPAAECIQ